MSEIDLWIWIVVGAVFVIALIVSVGNYLQNHRSHTQEEYWRAQEALRIYEEQQRSYDEHQSRATQQLDRQDALLDRVERLLDRLDEKNRHESITRH